MPQPLDAAAEAAEFSALVAELQSPEDDDDAVTEDAVETSDVEETEEVEESEADEVEEELEETEEETNEELSAEETAAKALFEAGDIKAACKKLGLDPKIFKINARQFTAMRKGLADAAKKEQEGTAKLNQGQQLTAKAEEVYGPIVAGFQAYKQGNPLNLRAAIELMCEDSFENVVSTVARAAKGLDPAQLEVIKLRKELADQKKAEAEAQSQQSVAAQEKAEVTKLTGLLKTTPLAKIDGAAEEIRALVVASYKPGVGYGLTVKQAYAQVKAKHERVAAAFGKAPKPVKAASKREELAPVRKEFKALSVADRMAQKKADEEAEFQRELKAAKEDVKRGQRVVRRAR